jgi:hypothetical protein
MSTFLSESNPKPNLVENHLVNKIIEEQHNKVNFEKKTIDFIKNLLLTYWKGILIILVICGLFYWRYIEIKKIRNKNKNVFLKSESNDEYEEDSETSTSSNF